MKNGDIIMYREKEGYRVLEDKKAQGAKSIEDWDRLDAKRMDSKRRKTQQRAQEAAVPEIDTSDTDRLWEKLRGKVEEV